MGSTPSKVNLVENGRIIIDIGVMGADKKIETIIPADSLLPITRRTEKEFIQYNSKGLSSFFKGVVDKKITMCFLLASL